MRKLGSRTGMLGLATVAALAAGWAGRALAQEKLGDEFQVNTYTTADQEDPALAVDASGDFVVVWESWGQDGDRNGVFGQRFDRTGAKLGGEFQVNTYTTRYQQKPAVAVDGSGGFVVVWESCLSDDQDCEVFGQRFDGAGAKVDGEFHANTTPAEDGTANPAVAADAGGGFVVVWHNYVPFDSYGGTSYEVFGQRFDGTGAKLGDEFQVNTYTTETQYLPAVAADGSGGFVVAWESHYQDGDRHGVFGQRFDADGAKVGGEFQVNTHTTAYQENPAVAADGSGNFVVAWESYYQDDGNYVGVFGQRFDGAGAKAGGEFQVNTYTPYHQREPSVAADPSGNFVVVWSSYPGDARFSGGVFGQRFDGTGTKVGGEFQVNTYTTNDQDDPVVGADASGNFVVVWQSYYQDGDGPSVFGQRFSALRSGCRAAEEQDLSLKAQGGQLDWRWKGGATAPSDFGDPTDDTAYRVCLYDGVSGTPAGGCSDVAPGDAWSQAPKGFRFQRPASAGGITTIRLEAGEAGQAELTVKGREVALPALPLAQQPDVVLELSNSAGECWQSRFATATRNDGSKFVARE